MNKIIKTRNFSGTQSLQYFNSTKNMKTNNDNNKLKLEEIKYIYYFLYEDNFPNILIQSKEIFMNNIECNINNIIKYHFDEMYINTTFFQQTLNKYRKEIDDKYLNDFSILNEQFQMTKNLKENQRIYLSHFLKHCINTSQYAYHLCPNNKKGKFILVEDKNHKIIKKKPEIKYVICFDCKQCYPSACIKMICTSCNYEYFSAVLKENEDSNIVLATWEKYHCGGTLQDQVMKCIKCKKELYINLTANKLFCKNCKFESKPNSILWKCYFCSQDFRSKVKIYNPLEFENMKKAINNALIMKIKANPKILPCCKKEAKDLTFYHKEECKGILYKGFLNGKEILVCKICHAMNFIDKFHWICPLCGKKFHLHHSASVTHYKLIRNGFNKEKINNNTGKKSTRIFFSLRKDSSSLFNKELEKEKKNIQKENINSLNKTKDENISYNLNTHLNTHINSYKNIRNKDYNKYNEIKNKEKNEIIKIIKIPQKDKNNSDFRNGYNNNKDIFIDLEKDDIVHKHKKKKRKTLYEILENKKKASINNISFKNTIESVLVEKNFNKTKNFNEEKLNIDKNENDINILSQTSLLPNQKKVFSNKDNQNKKYYDSKINDLIDVKEKEKKLNTYKKNQITQDNYANRNNNNINFMNSSDDLLKQKELIKCKSYNIFNNEKNNENNISTRNNNLNNINHQTNYLYTTNSNYNIKVTLNINHNICPYPKSDENECNNNIKKGTENNYKKIYNNAGFNKINEIYLNEILTNSKTNIDKQILVNNSEHSNKEKNLENIKNIKNNNFINKRKNLGYLSPKFNYNSEIKLVNSTKNDNAQKIGYIRRKKEIYYNTSNDAQKNSFLNSNKIKENKNLKKDFKFTSQHNAKNEPKKLIMNSKFNIFNKNNNSNSNIINHEIKTKNKNNLNYINVREKEINNNKINDNKNNNNDINSKNLKNKEEITKKEEETNKTKANLTKLQDMERTDTILNTTIKNVVNDQFKYDLMKNVIVSAETISQLTKESIIPNFNDKDFRYVRPIGEGAYGLIYLVENIHNRKQFALKKILCKDLYDIMKYKNQFELVYSISHKNLMEIYNLQYKYLDNTTYAIYVLMERAQNDWSIDIRKRIINKKPYKEEEIINILKQVVSALSYLQKKNIAHRDIKPQNILLFPGNIFKVADLGEARNVNDVNNKQMTLRGSELYMSPSLYARHKFNRKDAFHNAYKSDVFSLGFSTLYAMNLNLRIIENIRELSNMKIIINSIKKDMGKRIYSEKLMKIIYKMIEIDENKRYDFIELEKELNCIF